MFGSYSAGSNPDPRQKPPQGATVDWGHQLWRGLTFATLMNDASGQSLFDIAQATQMIAEAGADTPPAYPWRQDGYAMGATSTTSAIGLGFKSVQPSSRYVFSRYTVAIRARHLNGAASANYSPLVIAQTNSGANYNGLGLFQTNADTFAIYQHGASRLAVACTPLAIGRTYVATYDGALIKAYVDGAYVNQASYTSDPDLTPNPLRVGLYRANGNEAGTLYSCYNMLVEYVYIINRPWSADEVAWHYREPYVGIVWPAYRTYHWFGVTVAATNLGPLVGMRNLIGPSKVGPGVLVN